MNYFFDTSKAIELFKSELYKKYIDLISNNNLNKIIYKNGIIKINDQFIKPPKLKNIFEDIKESHEIKSKLLIEYYNLYSNIIYSKDPNQYKNKYNTIIEQIQQLDNKIKSLKEYYKLINIENNSVLLNTKIQYDNVLEKQNNIKTEIENDIYFEEVNLKKLSKYYIKSIILGNKLQENKYNNIDYYIISLPKFNVNINETIEKEEKSKKIIEEKPKEIIEEKAKETKPSNLSSKEINNIKTNIKQLISQKFKFRSMDECISSKRSQLYYMSKENIIKEIQDNPELRKLMPSNYRTLSKEKICEYLYSK